MSLKTVFTSVHKDIRQDESVSFAFLAICVREAFIDRNVGLFDTHWKQKTSGFLIFAGVIEVVIVVVIITAQFHSFKPELRFFTGSNPARGVSEIRDGEDL